MAEPARAVKTLPALVELDVRFQNDQLWKARYPSLIDDSLVPELQFEPAFQVCSEDPDQQVEIQFRIAEDENAEFVAFKGEVSWQSLGPGDPAPDVVVGLVGGDSKVCSVVWTRSGARLTALRIACQPLLGRPDQRAAADDNAAALMRVEGGVYLAIIDSGEVHRFPNPLLTPPPPKKPGRVRVVGIDVNSRPVYDLFIATNLPPELAPEPAIRSRHGEAFQFYFALDLPPGPYADVRFKVENNGRNEDHVVMTYVVPSDRPEELRGSLAGEENRLCQMQWSSPPCGNGTICTQGRAANLYAQLESRAPAGSPLGDAIAWVSVDPTVIEPPPCDASGVCTKPRDQGCG